MNCPFEGKYPYQLIWSGREKDEFYSFGSVWDCSQNNDHRYHSFIIGRGMPELVEHGSYDEPPFWEPYEYETIVVRAHIKK